VDLHFEPRLLLKATCYYLREAARALCSHMLCSESILFRKGWREGTKEQKQKKREKERKKEGCSLAVLQIPEPEHILIKAT